MKPAPFSPYAVSKLAAEHLITVFAKLYATGDRSKTWWKANLLAASTSNKLTGEVVNIACGERISLTRLLKYIGEEAGFPLEPIYEPTRRGDVRDSLASIDAAKAVLGLAKTFAAFNHIAMV